MRYINLHLLTYLLNYRVTCTKVAPTQTKVLQNIILLHISHHFLSDKCGGQNSAIQCWIGLYTVDQFLDSESCSRQ